MPEKTCNQFCHLDELRLKVLFKNNNYSTPYGIIKAKVAKFIRQNKPEEKSSFPQEVELLEDKMIVSLCRQTDLYVFSFFSLPPILFYFYFYFFHFFLLFRCLVIPFYFSYLCQPSRRYVFMINQYT